MLAEGKCGPDNDGERNKDIMPRMPELVVALDFPSAQEALACVRSMPENLTLFKVGLELFTAEGPAFCRTLTENRNRLFLDLKLHDIPNTVARAVRSATRLGASLLTVHASGGRDMLRAAVEAAREAGPNGPKLIAVTVLTSLNTQDLPALGIERSLSDQVLRLAELAVDCGIDGLVTSVHEASTLRAEFGPDPILVTPGIRPTGAATEDQKRTATLTDAVRAGADVLVVGRPITAAPNPGLAASTLLTELRRVLSLPPNPL